MVRRYFCEYCNKKFVDNLTNRRNHLKAVVHLRNKKLHYANFKDAEEVLREDVGRKMCRTFFTTGECEFGESCRFSHITDQRRQELLAEKKRRESRAVVSSDDVEAAIRAVSARKKNKIDNLFTCLPDGPLPQRLSELPAIPPSLLPAASADELTHNITDWG